MNYLFIIRQAQSGRPDLAAINAGILGSVRLAAYVARFPHESGWQFSAKSLVKEARRAARCVRNNRDI